MACDPTLSTLQSRTRIFFVGGLLGLLLVGLFSPLPLFAGGRLDALRLEKLIRHGGLMVQRGNSIVASQEPDTLLVPASTWKIATALEAIHRLGLDHRFETFFYKDQKDNLYIKGQGDPLLVSEEIAGIAAQLKKHGLRRVGNIILDDSWFAASRPVDGAGSTLNPYDVLNSGLAVNFNTINVLVAADGAITSAEEQTPTLPLMKKLGQSLGPGTHRINISQNPGHVLRHTGELFQALLESEGVVVSGTIQNGSVPRDIPLLFHHYSSKNLQPLLSSMLLYSNNFIANQLFLACGVRQFGPPASWQKGKEALQAFLQKDMNLDPASFEVEEGSGLSRKNRITPRAMFTLLEHFKPYSHLLPFDNGRLLKSGTLSGVFSYAGYFQRDNRLDSVVLILNQPRNTRDKLLHMLEQL